MTARDYAQTLRSSSASAIPHTAIGAHGGASRARKLGALASPDAPHDRLRPARASTSPLAHGSNDLALAAAALRIPAVNTFDYEWATQQHNIGCRLARRVIVPEAIPPERLRRYGVEPAKLAQYPGLKEEYYLADFKPDAVGARRSLASTRRAILVVVRPPPDVSLYHRKANRLFPEVLALARAAARTCMPSWSRAPSSSARMSGRCASSR